MEHDNMKIVVASGKGGTGKTTVATNLALAIGDSSPVVYVDCDVEEPNGHLFLQPQIGRSVPVGIPVPTVDQERCTGCGKCFEICQYNAIAVIKDSVLVFPELCHGCGGCTRACPEGAISETERRIGVLEEGQAGTLGFIHGRLDVGQVLSPPLIRAVKDQAAAGIQIIDAPPGTSCPVITTLNAADFVLLVTEPTPFGLHDLDLALQAVRLLGLPHALVVNRDMPENHAARDFCREHALDCLAEIPDDRRIAEAYSRGVPLINELDEYRELFVDLYQEITRRVQLAREVQQ